VLGDNTGGDLGNGTTTNSLVPMTVSGITSAIAVSVGGSAFACAVLSDGSVQWWVSTHLGLAVAPADRGRVRYQSRSRASLAPPLLPPGEATHVHC